MKLHFKKLGEGQPLIILHGLFGSLDNWQTLARQFSSDFEVYIIDQRNHGQSPQADEWNYQVMSDDLFEFFNDNKIQNAILLGHSLGGKTAMQFALEHTSLLYKLIIADISPKSYKPHHEVILEGLNSIDLSVIKSRQEVEEKLLLFIPDFGTRQFFMKNLYWKDIGNKVLEWRFNLKVIYKNINNVNEGFEDNFNSSEIPVLFLKGANSKYINESDYELIYRLFPNSKIETVSNSGHWLHAENPKEFHTKVLDFAKQ